MKRLFLLCGLAAALLTSCSNEENYKTLSGLDPQNFEAVIDSNATHLYTLKNAAGMEVCITNFGGRVVSIMVPDKMGSMVDVCLGFNSVADYKANPGMDFGASIGRYANRIDQGKITVAGEEIQLPQNNYGHCLHGGGWNEDKTFYYGWQAHVYQAEQPNDTTLVLTIVSPDGEANFPGEVTATVTYTLLPDNALDIQYSATTTAETVVNMTNHTYFNLNADPTKAITDNLLYINADKFTPVDSTFMTTGKIASVIETPLDFTQPTAIGDRIDDTDNQQIANGHGYDHNWVLSTGRDITEVAARVVSPVTGIVLEVYTDQPGLQVYTGNFLDGTVKGKGGIAYPRRAAICLETQLYPDSPNKRNVEGWEDINPYLQPGETYTHHCIYKFSVQK